MKKASTPTLMITPFLKSQRGNSLTALRIKKGLEGRGFQVHIITMEDPDWKNSLSFFLQNHEINLVHGFHGHYFGQALKDVPELKEKPLLLTLTGTDLNHHGAHSRLILKSSLQSADRIAVFNEDFKYTAAGAFPGAIDKLVTIPQGVCLEEGRVYSREELGLAEDDLVFLLPSGLRSIKNVDLAINALKPVQKEYPGVRLLIAGAAIEPDYSQYILGLIKELPWAQYLGERPHQEMKGLLQLSDVVLNTSRAEGQPQGALEGMSIGKPAILTAVPGNLRTITHGVEGYYIHDEEDLTIAAGNLAANPVLLEKMGQAARRLVEERYSLTAEILAYEHLYRELLSAKP